MSFGQRQKEQEWATDVMSVLLGWAAFVVEMRYGYDVTEEQVMESYPMATFKGLFERGVELGLLKKEDEGARVDWRRR